jgi:phosphatidate cytidylyltransferase
MLVRTISALILGPLILWILLAGPVDALFVILLLVTGRLLQEWSRMRPDFSLPQLVPWIVIGWGLLFLARFQQHHLIAPALCGAMMVMLALETLRYQPGVAILGTIGHQMTGLLYCVLPFLLFLDVRLAPQGPQWLTVLLAIIWATDSGAYLFGRWLGKRKLAPHLSPGKTIVGFGGGAFSGTCAGMLAVWGFGLDPGWGTALVMSLILSMMGQMGDLVESLIKRETGVKDAGRLIPGHGGLMDRLDSLLFVAPLFFFFVP